MLPIVNSPFNPLIASPVAVENPEDKNLRQMSWLLAMEKQELAEWLSHPFSGSPSEGAARNKSKDVEQDLFGTGAHRFMLRSADAGDSGSDDEEGASVRGSGAHRAESGGGISGKISESDAAGAGRAAHLQPARSQDLAEQQGAVIGGTSARIAPDEAESEDEAAAAAKDNGDRLVTISSDLQKLLSDLGLTKFQVGAAYAPHDEAETGLLLTAADENDIDGDESANADVDGAAANTEKTLAAPADNDKLRLHAELKNDEAHVWIGADRSLQLTGKHLDALTDQLQQMFSEQGTPLTSLIFNGRALIAAPRSQKLQGNTVNQAETGEHAFAELDNEHFMRKP